MTAGDETTQDAKSRERIVQRLDHMVRIGQISEEEAARLRQAGETSAFDAGIRAIRVRHAGRKLTAAVESGQMTQAEADAHLERLRNGEHPRSLRAELRKLLPK